MTSANLQATLAKATGTAAQDWHLVFKARYGMLAVFQALAATHPARPRVITQILTCSTAVDPILVAGLTPSYVEVSPATFSIDPDSVDLPDDLAAIVIQHTLGVIDEGAASRIAAAARDAGALVVEDSAHCVTRMARDAKGVPIADISVHSFGAEKMLPTKFGGAIWVNPNMVDTELRDAIVRELTSLSGPGARLALAARTYRWTRALVSRVPGGASVGHALEKTKLYSPAVAQSEREGRLAHGPVGVSSWVADRAALALTELPTIEARRAAATDAYVAEFGGAFAGQPLLRFPVLVGAGIDAKAVVAGLRKRGIYAGAWYRPALFPGVADPALYGYLPGTLPVTEDVIARIVNLPTDVEPDRAREIATAFRDLSQ